MLGFSDVVLIKLQEMNGMIRQRKIIDEKFLIRCMTVWLSDSQKKCHRLFLSSSF